MSQPIVTDADRKAAHEFRASGFAGWMDGAQTDAWLIERVAEAFAHVRVVENEACYRAVTNTECYTPDHGDDGCVCLAKAEAAIAARRDGTGVKQP